MLNQLIVNGIIAGSIYTLVAVGFAVIYRTIRFFHFAHGVVFTAGEMGSWEMGSGLPLALNDLEQGSTVDLTPFMPGSCCQASDVNLVRAE